MILYEINLNKKKSLLYFQGKLHHLNIEKKKKKISPQHNLSKRVPFMVCLLLINILSICEVVFFLSSSPNFASCYLSTRRWRCTLKVSELVKEKGERREGGYLLCSLAKEVSDCKQEW